jgi:hypothetical protein
LNVSLEASVLYAIAIMLDTPASYYYGYTGSNWGLMTSYAVDANIGGTFSNPYVANSPGTAAIYSSMICKREIIFC